MKRAERLNIHQIMINVERVDDRAKSFYTALGFAAGDIMHLKLR